ncbi:DUF3883 domain-containing protein [Flavobacterium sp. Sd200]|uniref:protein NO VEIN domain-containing protein n=1 Tax=Flavobacterium sp. Sd200 TaxID=2692211 RepID=UPI001371A657|nr:DUF3883 domain-containing protein [Flavobacterium sp. Sd200]MXN91708.1 DUF3883 domain-containing protein [Flavobacterium sp. Sd200]
MEENNFNVSNNTEIETAEDYQMQSELNDMRQHANKIIQGIKKLDSNDAHRAIWELFQNAVDSSVECHINIKITEDTFEFSHNGEPFTPMTLDCLFKQVSSKTLEEKKQVYNESDPVGQYGTGFMTSHVFGKEFRIDGFLAKRDGYVPVNNFLIDRTTDNWKVLAGNISALKKKVAALLNETPSPQTALTTNFTYTIANEYNRKAAANAVNSLKLILPYVMTLNKKLSSVTVIDKDLKKTVFEKQESYAAGKVHIRPISTNGSIQEVCYLEDLEKKIIIILPLNSNLHAFSFDEQLPRLFLYYPLVGTQKFGNNFIINSRQFQPTEPRDGIHLKSDNDSNFKDEEANRTIIKNASKIIFDFLRENASLIKSPVKLAKINFVVDSDDLLLNEYFKAIKAEWISEFKDLPLVETNSGNLRPSDAMFIHQELLMDENKFDAIYSLTEQFWGNIPKIDIIKEWTQKIDEWNIDDIQYIKINDITSKIQEAGNLTAFPNPDDLKQFYAYLVDQKHETFFNTFKLLPNIKGEFRVLSGNDGLNNGLNLPEKLIEIADILLPEIPKRHVHPEFKFTLEFTDYTRKNYTSEINEHVAKIVNEKALSEAIDQGVLLKLLEYCKITTTTESGSVPSKTIKLICRHFEQSEEMIVIPIIKDDEFDIRPSQKRVLKLLLNDISVMPSAWVTDNIDFLKEIISTCAEYEAYEDMFETLAVFPNQLNELMQQNYLRIDASIPDKIKDLFDIVIKPSIPIRSTLIHPDFENFLKNKQQKTIRDLTEKIESAFFDEQTYATINEHVYKKEILEIIEEIKNSKEYEKHYPLIFSKRSGILVDLADGEDTFSILSLNSTRIKELAVLGNDPDFAIIVKLGQEALIKQQQQNADFQHKRAIGTHIEGILRKNLSAKISGNIKVDVEDIQDGQDIIISINKQPLYYIEVKSRWDVNSSIRMSKNQTLRADEQKDNYALCSVDMTKYKGEKKYAVDNIEDIDHCIKFNTSIGYEVSHLIEVLNQTNDFDTIHLDGDYKTLVPMKFIDNGMTIKDFEVFMINFLNTKFEKLSNDSKIIK